MSTTRTMGIEVTDVSTTQRLPLGFEYHSPASPADSTTVETGSQVWVYVFNDDPTNAFVAGAVVYRLPASTTEDFFGGHATPITTHQPQVMCIGVAQHAIPTGSYGFVLKRGVGLILSGSAGVAADSPFTSGGDEVGSVLVWADDASGAWGSNISVIGHTATAIGADTTGTAYISCG